MWKVLLLLLFASAGGWAVGRLVLWLTEEEAHRLAAEEWITPEGIDLAPGKKPW